MTLEQDSLVVHYLGMQEELKASQWGRHGGSFATNGALVLLVTNAQILQGQETPKINSSAHMRT